MAGQVQSLAQELPHAVGVAKIKNKNKRKEKEEEEALFLGQHHEGNQFSYEVSVGRNLCHLFFPVLEAPQR